MVFRWFWGQATIGFDGFWWLSTIAQWRKPLTNLNLRILPKWSPLLPFSHFHFLIHWVLLKFLLQKLKKIQKFQFSDFEPIFTMKGSPDHFCIFYLFFVNDMKHTWCKFHSGPTSSSWLFTEKWKKYTQYLTFLTKKNIWHKIWVILHHPKKVWTKLDQK